MTVKLLNQRRVKPKLTDTLGVSLYVSTAVFALVLAVVFAVWYRQEHTLAITSIDTPRREGFYWGAILTTRTCPCAGADWSRRLAAAHCVRSTK